MATNADDTAVDALPEELLLDILARLPDPVDLLRCAATCKRWLRLLAAGDAAILRRAGLLPENRNRTPLLGAFYQNDYGVERSPQFWSLHGQPPAEDVDRRDMLLHRAASTGRLHGLPPDILPNHNGLFNYVKPLASRRGLLLVRLMPAPLDHRKLHLAVCHPILGGVHLVPSPPLHLHPPFQGRDVTGYALITGHGGDGLDNQRQRRLALRVLFTAVRLDRVVCAYSYSSATGTWSAPTTCPQQMQDLTMSGPRAGVIDGRGTAHWLYRVKGGFYTLDVTADAAHVSLTKIPMKVPLQPPFPCITRGGNVSFVCTRPQGQGRLLQLWTRQDEDDDTAGGGWQCSDLGLLQMPYGPLKIIGFAESRGAILLKLCSGLFCFDIESRELELVRRSEYTAYPTQVCSNSTCQGYNSCTQCIYNNSVLYEMDWSSYLLHLSAWNLRGASR